MLKALGERWKELTERARFDALAAADQQRYREEMKARARQGTPGVTPEAAALLVGKAIEIYWDGNVAWYGAQVRRWDGAARCFTVVYDDDEGRGEGAGGRDSEYQEAPAWSKWPSWCFHGWPPEASLAAFEGFGLPSALVSSGPASQMPSRGRGSSASGRPS